MQRHLKKSQSDQEVDSAWLWKPATKESNELQDDLIVRGFLEENRNSQLRIVLRNRQAEAEPSIATVLEKAPRIKAITRIEEKETEAKVAVVLLDTRESFIDTKNFTFLTLRRRKSV